MKTRGSRLLVLSLAAAACGGLSVAAVASTFADDHPALRAPVSAFARPASWLDPTRLSLSGSVSFATLGGGSVHGLQVATLRYRLASPWTLQVNLGSALGPRAGARDGLFLEGVNLTYRPSATTWFQVRYQDLRSPLQLSRSWGY